MFVFIRVMLGAVYKGRCSKGVRGGLKGAKKCGRPLYTAPYGRFQLTSTLRFQPVRREAQKGRRDDTFSWWCFAVCGPFLPPFSAKFPEKGTWTLDNRLRTIGVGKNNNFVNYWCAYVPWAINELHGIVPIKIPWGAWAILSQYFIKWESPCSNRNFTAI